MYNMISRYLRLCVFLLEPEDPMENSTVLVSSRIGELSLEGVVLESVSPGLTEEAYK